MIDSRKGVEVIGECAVSGRRSVNDFSTQPPSMMFPIDLSYFDFLKKYGLATILPFTTQITEKNQDND